MARKVQGRRKIDTMTEPETGIEITLYLYSKDHTFEANVGTKSFKGTNGQDVIAKAEDYIRQEFKLNFFPVIVITEAVTHTNRKKSCFVGFEMDKFYIAKQANGEYACLLWESFDPNSPGKKLLRYSYFRHTPDSLPYESTDRYSRTWIIAYSDDAWAGFLELKKGIQTLKERLFDLLGTQEGLGQIAQVGASLLKMLPEQASPE